mgnify:CR=1 FL=1
MPGSCDTRQRIQVTGRGGQRLCVMIILPKMLTV